MDNQRRRMTDRPDFVRRLARTLSEELEKVAANALSAVGLLAAANGNAPDIEAILARALLVAMTNDAKGEE